jgi:hypothetical protein
MERCAGSSSSSGRRKIMQETHGAYTVSMGIVVLGVTILYSQHQPAICATVAIRRDAQVRHMKCWKRRQRKAWALRIAVIFAAKVSHGMSDGRWGGSAK